jgi:hypothetical protein
VAAGDPIDLADPGDGATTTERRDKPMIAMITALVTSRGAHRV